MVIHKRCAGIVITRLLIIRNAAHYRPRLRTPFPFDFEFFVVAILLNVPGIILVSDNRNIFSF